MNEYTVAETEAAPITHTKDSQYQLSKKVAQLIKVIVQLNVVNETYSADKKRLIDAHNQEIKVVSDDSDARLKLLQDELLSLQGIKHAKDEADESQKILEEKVHSLRELMAKNTAREADSHEILASIKREAKAEVEELQRNRELERLSQAQTVRDISHSLEEQLRQNQDDVLLQRNKLADEHNRHIENFREELTTRHADEILLLKSRHEKNILRVKSELSEQGKLAVENAIAKTRLEYEERLSQQLFSCVKNCEETKAEAIVIVGREKKSLEEELERMKLRANEIPILKERLDGHVGYEKKLQSEVTRLQNSLDSISAINQRVVRELQTNNTELCDGLQIAHDASQKQLECIRSLEGENNELKVLLDRIDAQKSSVKSELKAVQLLLDKECQLGLSQLGQRDSRIRSLQGELDGATASNKDMNEKLLAATADIALLDKYKHCVQQTLPPLLQLLKRDTYQSKNDITELKQLLTSTAGKLFEWKQRLTCAHVKEMTKFIEREKVLHEREKVLQDRVDALRFEVEARGASLAEATNLKSFLEKKIEVTEETARNAAVARMGERLSWEKALEDMKEHHQKEFARMCCKFKDEADILGNHIAELKATIEKQKDHHEHKCQIMVTDWQKKSECHNADLSRLKHDSALENQALTQKLAECNDNISSKELGLTILVNNIDSMRERQISQERNHLHELELLSKRHQSELKEGKRLYEQIRQKYDVSLQFELEMATESTIYQKRIAELNGRLASERSKMISELANTKSQLCGLRLMAIQHTDDIKQEWVSLCGRVILMKLKSMKQTLEATRQKRKQEIDQLRATEISLEKRLAAVEKEAQDAKTMLFNTIRESETKLERAVRHLLGDHKLEVEALVNASKIECEAITAKFEQKSKECEYHLSVNAAKADIIIRKDCDMEQLKTKLTDTVRSYEDEILSFEVQRETDRHKVVIESKTKEASMMEDFTKEKSKIQSELQTQMTALQAANERWNSRPSLQKDLEVIKSLQDNIQHLSTSENETRARMLYYKRELENRETSYNKRFFPEGNDGTLKNIPLRVIQNGNDESKAKTTTTKVRNGTGAMKKNESFSKLPKIM